MYMTSPNTATPARGKRGAVNSSAFLPESVLRILTQVETETDDSTLCKSLHFTTGIVDRIERQLSLGCTVITDSNLVYTGLKRGTVATLPVNFECFMDDPLVVNFATQKRITRAEVAIEQSLAVPGPKLIVIGSAPMALNRLLQLHAAAPLHDVAIIAAAAGFASIVELKEQLWESRLPCIVVRGRKGGPNAAIAITNALLEDAVTHII